MLDMSGPEFARRLNLAPFVKAQQCLISCVHTQGKQCLFLETAVKVRDMNTHAMMECIPVSADAFARAPLVFRQEIGEAESEWSQHHMKRLLDTSEKGLRRSVPESFPYFHVQFGYRQGVAHVIDDEGKWQRGFGRSVVVGLLGNREEDMFRRAQRDDVAAQEANKAAFLDTWDAFDWTKQLD
jgi:Protein similar to CwfJ C-terminus 2/Protein similar to CwfJ C-terminus 1